MPKYKIQMSETVIYEREIEATDLQNAEDIVLDLSVIDMNQHIIDSNGFQIDSIEEIKE